MSGQHRKRAKTSVMISTTPDRSDNVGLHFDTNLTPGEARIVAETLGGSASKSSARPHVDKLRKAAQNHLPRAAAFFLEGQFGQNGWKRLLDATKEMSNLASALSNGRQIDSHYWLEKCGEQKGGDKYGSVAELANDLFKSSDTLKGAWIYISNRFRKQPRRPVSKRWLHLDDCECCGRLTPAFGSGKERCPVHRGNSYAAAQARKSLDRFNSLFKDYYQSLPAVWRPNDGTDGHYIRLTLMGEMSALQNIKQTSGSLETLLGHFPLTRGDLRTRAVNISDAGSILTAIDPLGTDTFGIQKAAHTAILTDARLAARMLCRTEARLFIDKERQAKHGGRRAGAGRQPLSQLQQPT
jgi:hypothetical protein